MDDKTITNNKMRVSITDVNNAQITEFLTVCDLPRECWLQIALNYKKIKRVRKLMVLNKECYRVFTELDVLKLKFNRDFPDRAYHNWWKPLENYMLQSKYNGIMCSLIGLAKTNNVDCIFRKRDPKRNKLLKLQLTLRVSSNCQAIAHTYNKLSGRI